MTEHFENTLALLLFFSFITKFCCFYNQKYLYEFLFYLSSSLTLSVFIIALRTLFIVSTSGLWLPLKMLYQSKAITKAFPTFSKKKT